MHISVVIPVYNSYDCLEELAAQLAAAFTKINRSYEIIFVNDASQDRSWSIIERLIKTYTQVQGINLPTNIGQHAAIAQGICRAKGTWIVVMDGDLQDNPKYIPLLYKTARGGHDVVFTRKISRNWNTWYMMFVKCYHLVLAAVTGMKSDASIGNYCIFNQTIRKRLIAFPYLKYSFLQSIRRFCIHPASISIEQDKRYAGSSTYSFFSLMRLAVRSFRPWVSDGIHL